MCCTYFIYYNRQLHAHKQLSLKASIVITLHWNERFWKSDPSSLFTASIELYDGFHSLSDRFCTMSINEQLTFIWPENIEISLRLLFPNCRNSKTINNIVLVSNNKFNILLFMKMYDWKLIALFCLNINKVCSLKMRHVMIDRIINV